MNIIIAERIETNREFSSFDNVRQNSGNTLTYVCIYPQIARNYARAKRKSLLQKLTSDNITSTRRSIHGSGKWRWIDTIR